MKKIGIKCVECGAVVERKSPSQRYCPECSEKRDLERKRLWARGHPSQKTGEKSRAARQRAKEVGVAISENEKLSITWAAQSGPDLEWLVRVSVPFGYAYSKNHILTTNRRGHVFLREEHRKARNDLIGAFRRALKNQHVAQNKLWIDILVQKPNHKGDAVNVVDSVCDAIKECFDLDDRWFSIRRLDWQVVKTDPQLIVGIGQESSVDLQICSTCGRALPVESFHKNRSNKSGRGRVCGDCRRVQRKGERLLRGGKREAKSSVAAVL